MIHYLQQQKCQTTTTTTKATTIATATNKQQSPTHNNHLQKSLTNLQFHILERRTYGKVCGNCLSHLATKMDPTKVELPPPSPTTKMQKEKQK